MTCVYVQLLLLYGCHGDPRCFAAVGDISKTRYLRDIIEIADTITADTVRVHH